MNQKGFINILLIVIIVALVGAGVYVALTKQVTPPTPTPRSNPTSTPTPTSSPTPKPTSTESNQTTERTLISMVEYSCRVPCTGAMPSSRVEQDCSKLLSQEQCISYTSNEFPFRCEWRLTNYQCPHLP